MLSSSEMPSLLRRPHIHRGYRPLNQPKHYYVGSAFSWHNELVNVWTHLLPVFYLLWVYFIPEARSPSPRFPVLLLCFGTLILLLGSSFAHLLHSRSLHDHIFWLLVDFAGIAIFALCIGLQRFGCENGMHPWLQILYLPSLIVVAILGQFLSTCTLFVLRPHWQARTAIRMMSCLVMAIWLYLPIMHRYLTPTPDSSLHPHNRAFQWLLISGVFMGASVPERFAPGYFDVIGYGHQLFHLCIIMVSWNLLEAAQSDCEASAGWMESRNAAVAGTVLLSVALIAHTLHSLVHKAATRKYD